MYRARTSSYNFKYLGLLHDNPPNIPQIFGLIFSSQNVQNDLWLSLFILSRLLTSRVLQKLGVHLSCWQLNIPDHRPPDEAMLDWEHVRMLIRVSHADISQLYVEVLVHTVQCSADWEIILQLHHNILAHQGFEEGLEQHVRAFAILSTIERVFLKCLENVSSLAYRLNIRFS